MKKNQENDNGNENENKKDEDEKEQEQENNPNIYQEIDKKLDKIEAFHKKEQERHNGKLTNRYKKIIEKSFN